MPDRIPESMSEYMAERISEYIYMCVCVSLPMSIMYFHMVCQKLFQNKVTGRASLEECNFRGCTVVLFFFSVLLLCFVFSVFVLFFCVFSASLFCACLIQ